MSTLLLRLAGPMQSWGTQSRFTIRDTGLEPSKSGVIGLLCAALGHSREEPVDNLARLRMGVRVDHEGQMKMDYHTAGGTHRVGDEYGVARASGKGRETVVVSRRYYLADADFLVGLEGDNDEFLRELHQALERPHWQIFLGRKSFVPGVPVRIPDGLRVGMGLKRALTEYEWPLASPWLLRGSRPEKLRLVLEAESGKEVRQDQPCGAAFLDRSFRPRCLITKFLLLGREVPIVEV